MHTGLDRNNLLEVLQRNVWKAQAKHLLIHQNLLPYPVKSSRHDSMGNLARPPPTRVLDGVYSLYNILINGEWMGVAFRIWRGPGSLLRIVSCSMKLGHRCFTRQYHTTLHPFGHAALRLRMCAAACEYDIEDMCETVPVSSPESAWSLSELGD